MSENICVECGNRGLKRGWTMAWYCSEQCERKGVEACHRSMPGGGGNCVQTPWHTIREIRQRWEGVEVKP